MICFVDEYSERHVAKEPWILWSTDSATIEL